MIVGLVVDSCYRSRKISLFVDVRLILSTDKILVQVLVFAPALLNLSRFSTAISDGGFTKFLRHTHSVRCLG